MPDSTHDKSTRLSHPKYRPDIDGLRAIAIIGVVWYHTLPSSLRSGFIGVDIFFVISGYLISSIIISNLEAGTFSLAEFYIRRIRRILPALLFIMLTCFTFGWFALTAAEFSQLGKHIAAGAAFISNFVLWTESGYFDAAAETKPLLHLWSLAIEEQYYIFWPLLLSLVWKSHRNALFLYAIVTLAVLSFGINVYQTTHDHVAAFYSPFARFWELMAGSILAYISLHRPSLISFHRNLQSIAGFILLIIGFVVIDRWRHFPGWWALLPVAGSFLLIAAGPTAWVNSKLLSNRSLVWVGLISYPLYLWHWPMLSFMRIIISQELSVKLGIMAVLISVVMAWLSNRFIEQPCRFGRFRLTTSSLLLFSLVSIGIVGYMTHANHGFKSRPSAPELHAVNRGEIGNTPFLKQIRAFYSCQPNDVLAAAMRGGCKQSAPTGNPELAIIGDSHAQHLFLGVAEASSHHNIMFYMQDGLPTLSNPQFHHVMEHVIHNPAISKVLLTAFWSWRIRNDKEAEAFRRDFKETVNALTAAGKSVYIVAGDVPNFSFDPSLCKYSGRLGLGIGPVNQCSESSSRYLQEKNHFQTLIKKAISPGPQVTLLDLSSLLCKDGMCDMARDGVLFYRDRNHLNADGSRYLGPKILELVGMTAHKPASTQ